MGECVIAVHLPCPLMTTDTGLPCIVRTPEWFNGFTPLEWLSVPSLSTCPAHRQAHRQPPPTHMLATLPVTRHAGVTQARGLGRVRLGVHTDVASASGLLHRLVFRVRVLVTVEGSVWGVTARGAEGQEGYKCRVDNISWQCYSITKLILLLGFKGPFIQYGGL